MTLLCLDTETTGLELENHCIWQISGIFKNNSGEESFDFKMKPFRGDPIDASAFVKTGVSQEELDTYPDQKEAFEAFTALLKKYGTKEDGTKEKIYIIGYNVKFDIDFIDQWFNFNKAGKLWWSSIWWPYIDVMTLAATHLVTKRPELENFRLTTVYKYIFNEDFKNAHSADADVEATWRLFKYLYVKMNSIPQVETRKI